LSKKAVWFIFALVCILLDCFFDVMTVQHLFCVLFRTNHSWSCYQC